MSAPTQMLGLSEAQAKERGAYWTTREILQQPRIWAEVVRQLASDAGLRAFLDPLLSDPSLRIVLTGAGTSSFIGQCLAPALARTGHRAAAVATTDIVATPASLLSDERVLVVHFARSGNSPESVAAMELAEQGCPQCSHLVLTCNPQGALLNRSGALRHGYAVLLPEGSDDRGFAMTSSFTGLLLAAALALRLIPPEPARLARLGAVAAQLMTAGLATASALAATSFERVVFLGSGELKGLAHEAALKMLELTDGRVVTVADSPLGFRHGPKAVVNGKCLVIMFVSDDPHTRRYDLDVLAELRRDGVAGRVVALSNRRGVPAHPDALQLEGSAAAPSALESPSDLELCLPYAVFAQMLAVLRSLSLGVTPDTPNAAGTVNRVVKGVTIYPYDPSP